jgi:hypothetical protein
MDDLYDENERKISVDQLVEFEEEDQIDIIENWFRSTYQDSNDLVPHRDDDTGEVIYFESEIFPDDVLPKFLPYVKQNVIDAVSRRLNDERYFEPRPDEWWAHDNDSDAYLGFIETKEECYKYFSSTMYSLERLRKLQTQSESDKKTLNSMIYISILHALEAYLKDSTYIIITNNEGKRKEFYNRNKNRLKLESIKSIDVSTGNFSIKEINQKLMRYFSFRELKKVKDMYEKCFKAAPKISDDESDAIIKAFTKRDYLVHHGAKDENDQLISIDDQMVEDLLQKTQVIVEKFQASVPVGS